MTRTCPFRGDPYRILTKPNKPWTESNLRLCTALNKFPWSLYYSDIIISLGMESGYLRISADFCALEVDLYVNPFPN